MIAGEGGVNYLKPLRLTPPIVEVRDRAGQPVAGADVAFVLHLGPQGIGGVQILSAKTDSAGRATPAAFHPPGLGFLEIQVTAAFQGEKATATIRQTTLAVSPDGESGAVETPGGGARLATNKWLWTGIAGGAAGIAGGRYVAGRNKAPLPSVITFSPPTGGMAQATRYTFTAGDTSDPDGDSLTYSWDFGDGGRAGGQTVTHVYGNAGTFTVKLSVHDAQTSTPAETTVVTVLRNLASGFWTGITLPVSGCTAGVFFGQTQSTLSGALNVFPCVPIGFFEGIPLSSLSVSGPTYPMTITWDSGTFQLAPNSQSPPQPVRLSFSGTTDALGTTMTGTLTTTEGGGPSLTTQVVLRRP